MRGVKDFAILFMILDLHFMSQGSMSLNNDYYIKILVVMFVVTFDLQKSTTLHKLDY